MSRLEELIQEFCPNGVEYKKLGEIATISRGGSFQKKDFTENGFPCIHYGQIHTYYILFADKTLSFISAEVARKQKIASQNDIIMAVTSEDVKDVCKCIAWLGHYDIAVSGHTAIIHHSQNAKYLSYYFHTEMFAKQKDKLAHGTKVIEVTPDALNGIVLPVPPLPVQREIVRILDNFTELTAREKQYEYYRDKIINCESAQWTTLGDNTLFNFHYGKGNNIPADGGIYEVYGCNGAVGNTSSYNCEDVPVVGHIGSAGVVNWGGGKVFVTYNGTICDVVDRTIISTKFLYYFLQYSNLPQYLKGSQPFLSVSDFQKVKFPILSFEQQQRIVSILDRFDFLCNDISSGLPAEIAARQKQYEYYRDKLLTFKELKV